LEELKSFMMKKSVVLLDIQLANGSSLQLVQFGSLLLSTAHHRLSHFQNKKNSLTQIANYWKHSRLVKYNLEVNKRREKPR